jgi:hypothetical protein
MDIEASSEKSLPAFQRASSAARETSFSLGPEWNFRLAASLSVDHTPEKAFLLERHIAIIFFFFFASSSSGN